VAGASHTGEAAVGAAVGVSRPARRHGTRIGRGQVLRERSAVREGRVLRAAAPVDGSHRTAGAGAAVPARTPWQLPRSLGVAGSWRAPTRRGVGLREPGRAAAETGEQGMPGGDEDRESLRETGAYIARGNSCSTQHLKCTYSSIGSNLSRNKVHLTVHAMLPREKFLSMQNKIGMMMSPTSMQIRNLKKL